MADPNFPLILVIFFTSLLATVLAERFLLPRLRSRASQPIYEEGPSWHKAKSGTPTMGGLGFLFAIFLSLLPMTVFLGHAGDGEESLALLLALGYALLNALIGIFDDLTKLKRRENAGLTPKEKLFFQSVAAILFLFARRYLFADGTALLFSFGKLDLGVFYYPFAFLLLLGFVNSANLTDGIDGLASGVAFSIGVALLFLSSGIYADVSFLSAAVIGGTLGFLFFNLHPAKIFMGDTGSLFLGALLSSAVFSFGNPLLFLPIGAVYVVEGTSVVLQVLHYKRTKKRLFLMAPLHHHLEKLGLSENRICLIAIFFTLLCSLLAVWLLAL